MAKRKKRVEQEAEVVVIPVDFREVLPQILARVADVNDLESWKAAFLPQIEFMEVDEGLTGKRIDWEARSPVEIAAYVAYMADPQKVKIDYEIDAEGYGIRVSIDDSERAWYLWFNGCFDYFDESKGGSCQMTQGKFSLDMPLLKPEVGRKRFLRRSARAMYV